MMMQHWLVKFGMALAVAAPLGGALGQVMSMPPAPVEGAKAATAQRFLGSAAASHHVVAAAWTAPREALNAAAAQPAMGADRSKALQIGFPREIPVAQQRIALASLAWQTLSDGSRVARVALSASDAAGMRLAYQVIGPNGGMALRFAGDNRDETYLSEVGKDDAITWSPVLEGASASLEMQVLPGFSPEQFTVRFDSLSHLVTVGASLGAKNTRDIGQSGSCNRDVACVSGSNSALASLAKSVAKLVFTDAGSTYSCSGTLINGTAGGNLLYTAAHCIDNQAAASTLNTYWFFDAISCGSTAIPPYQLVTGGSVLLTHESTLDAALLLLNQSPPTGAIRAGWNATVFATGLPLVGVHHPQGDLKKYSAGNMRGYAQGPQYEDSTLRPQYQRDSFITVQWSLGTTEAGSSGSGVFTLNTAGGYYELRGGLHGGAASCDNQSGIDRYSRMDLLFTKLAPYLSPESVIPASNSAVATMVEYYMPQFDYYFMTSRENEKTTLDTYRDSNNNPQFYRTGYWFKVDPFASPTTASISRYLVPGAARGGARSSHFYTALNSDKQAISASGKERFAVNCAGVPNGYFCNEGIDSYIAPPIGTGASATCLNTEQKIYRVFRGSPQFVDDANHRYVNNETMYNYMVADQRWSGEDVNFCANK